MTHEKPDAIKEITRSCPEYFARAPFIAEVWNDLADYKRGALGPVGSISAPHLTLLRILDAETNSLEAHVNEALFSDKAST